MTELHATFDAELLLTAQQGDNPGDDAPTTVQGMAVPYGVVGHTSQGPVVFARGSVPVDAADVPLLLDHDPQRPIGVVTALVDDEPGLRFSAALDPVQAARDAHVQMKTRSRRGVSIGVDVVDADQGADGITYVKAAALRELSSVTLPAYPGALVAAARGKKTDPPPEKETETVTETAEKHPTPSDDVDADTLRNVTSAPSRPVPRTVEAFAAQLAGAVRAGDADHARDVTRLLAQAEQVALRAALSDVTTSEWPPPGTFVSELDNMVRHGMPTVEAFTVRPTDRWPVKQRQIDTWPTAGKQTAEKTEIPSTPVVTSWANIADETYAHGLDVSLQDVEDNGEQVLTDIFEITAEVVANQINADALAAINTAAGAGTSGVTLDNIGAALGAVQAEGYGPPVIVAAPDVWGTLWSLTAGGGPALARLGGLDMAPQVISDKQVTPGTMYVGARRAFRTYLSRTSRLRAVEVSLLGVNVGLYQRAAFRVVDAGAITKLTAA